MEIVIRSGRLPNPAERERDHSDVLFCHSPIERAFRHETSWIRQYVLKTTEPLRSGVVHSSPMEIGMLLIHNPKLRSRRSSQPSLVEMVPPLERHEVTSWALPNTLHEESSPLGQCN